jgi:hypothetical protein
VKPIQIDKNNHQDYISLDAVDPYLDALLKKLELIFFDISTSLAIADMFLKEQRTLKIDKERLEELHKRLDKEMKIFEERFGAGIFEP